MQSIFRAIFFVFVGAVLSTPVDEITTQKPFFEATTQRPVEGTSQKPVNFVFPPLPKTKEFASDCSAILTQAEIDEIKGYKGVVDLISQTVLRGQFKGKLYGELAIFLDHHGHRLTGTPELERAIDALVENIKANGLNNVRTEPFNAPAWIRVKESAELIEPRKKNLHVLGLGTSVPTPPGGITAEVLVIESFDELAQRSSEAKGKIVVYAQDWVRYRETVQYRISGATEASKHGAVAALIRSVTPFSINSPHTGIQKYGNDSRPIPVAAITVEDAKLLQRLQSLGKKIVIKLELDSNIVPNVTLRNTVVEYEGKSRPEKRVLVSGHIDSWDVGQGAQDDAGGCFVSWFVPYLFRELNLRPRRTIQTVLFSAEEQGLIGAQFFRKEHAAEVDRYVAVMEADIGTFSPSGFSFSGSDKAGCIVRQIVDLLGVVNATRLTTPHDGSDIYVFENDNITQLSLTTDEEKYFWFHHTHADTLEILDPDELDRCLVAYSVVSYVIADLEKDLQ